VVLLYYILRLGCEALVETGRLSPFVGTWTPNAIFAAAGILLFLSAALEKPLSHLLARSGMNANLASSGGGSAARRSS
jgi:hypothetical protein